MNNKNIILIKKKNYEHSKFEFVERKGIGHPDTLADALAEELSRVYSNYTISKFGTILHHNFDKVGLLGGKSSVKFGEGRLTSPIRVLLNGRASICFGNTPIPVKELLEGAAKRFLVNFFPLIDAGKDIEIHFNLSNSSSPGNTENSLVKDNTRKYWFEPRNFEDLPELVNLFSNDTSLGCSYAPLSLTENIVLKIERYLNSPEYKKSHPWLGTDIKIMASMLEDLLDMTLALPLIANHVPDARSYKNNLEIVKLDILEFIKKIDSNISISLHVNTRDDYKKNEFYLTAIGSSIETGDEGLVGRGNRINGLITPLKPMSIEGACGKNPVYHVGKLYNIAAANIAQKLHEITRGYVEVFLVSQSGRDLLDPWKIIVSAENNEVKDVDMIEVIEEEIKKITNMKDSLLKGEIQLF